jgi:D-3-phosphoglycerate dehydrogenase
MAQQPHATGGAVALKRITPMPKVLISDALSPAAVAVFESRGIEADVNTGLSESELIEAIAGYDGLVVRSATKVTARVLDAAPQLRVVGRAGIGIDNIDLEAATARGVVVMNTPFGNSVTTAEHTIAMMLALARQLPAADRSTRSGRWEKSRFMGMEVAGKVLGLIGCGNIGAIVADRAHGLKMRVIAYDPYLGPERAQDLGVEKVEMEQLLARADVISLHTPLNDGTRNLLSAAALAKTRPGVRIINCARGGLLDEAALHQAIVEGRVAGAALDAFVEEPARSSPLFDLEQVVVTPHLGASTVEAQEKVALQVAEQMADYLTTGAVINALNMPSVTAEEAPRLQPYMKLAGQLGSFAGQLTETGLRSATITYAGQVASLNTRPLTAALLQGLLAPLLDSVNMVNAPSVARERNIAVTTIHQESIEGYQTLIRLSVSTERGERSVAGTLFHEQRPRLVEIRGIEVDAQLGPHMLYVRNDDRPGLIGGLGSALGNAGVNIATFHLGRTRAGGDAIALIEVDQPVPHDVLQQICALPHVTQCKALRF